MITNIGFTGSRFGMSESQMSEVLDDLWELIGPDTKIHHGDCVGADEQFHTACRNLGLYIVGHPPIKDEFRAFCDFDESELPKANLVRDQDIVNASDFLIATPSRPDKKGGTWATIKMAEKKGIPIHVILPA